jgi:DNA processing protein
VTSSGRACDACLGRAALLGRLAPYIEKVTTREPGSGASQLLGLADEALAEALRPGKGKELLAAGSVDAVPRLQEDLENAGCWSLCRHDDSYPDCLRESAEAPAALLCRGDAEILRRFDHDAAVTVVGSRRASAYGREVAKDLARLLSEAGLTVTSGMANGIDAAAHEGALDGRAPTIAVLGSGPDVPYPRGRWRLFKRISESGLVMSELPPGTEPWRWTFPARNRIMAALGRMTVVVEAAERSGSLITAEMAIDLGRLVGAVPGPVNSWLSAGANALLHDGAAVVRDAQDVLDAMLGPGAAVIERHGPPLDAGLAATLAALGKGTGTCDAIAAAAGLDGAATSSGLARLELLGYVRSDLSGRYTRTLLAPPPKP